MSSEGESGNVINFRPRQPLADSDSSSPQADSVRSTPARIDSLESFRGRPSQSLGGHFLGSSISPRAMKDDIRRMTESMWGEGLKPGAEELRSMLVDTLISLYGATRAAKIVARLDIIHNAHEKAKKNTLNSIDQEE